MLIKEWRTVLRGAWSVWLGVLSAVLTAALAAIEAAGVADLGLTPAQYLAICSGLNVAIVAVRLIRQPNLAAKVAVFLSDQSGAVSRRAVGGMMAAALVSAVTLVGGFEGLRTKAYQDAVGVWTICYGETRGVSPGDVATVAECDAMLAEAIVEFDQGLSVLIDDPIEARLPDGVRIALVSWAYNVGLGNARTSTLIRLINAGDFRAACDQLPRWNRAGGRVLRGLTNRRLSERAVCLKGLGA